MKRIITILFLALVTISANAQQWCKQWNEADPMYNREADWFYGYAPADGDYGVGFNENNGGLVVHIGNASFIDYTFLGNIKVVDVKMGFYIDGEFQHAETWTAIVQSNNAHICSFHAERAEYIKDWLLHTGEVRFIIPRYLDASFDKTFPKVTNPIVL